MSDARASGIEAVMMNLQDCDPEESLTQEVGLSQRLLLLHVLLLVQWNLCNMVTL